MHRSYSGCSAIVRRPSAPARSSVDGARNGSWSGSSTSGRSATVASRGIVQPLGLLVALEIEPAVGDVIAGEEVLDLVAPLRPSVTDDAQTARVVRVRLSPVAQQVVEDGVEPLLRRMPRFEQVVVQPDVVDGPDGHIRVGVGREQDELGLWGEYQRLCEELHAGHARHPLIGRDQRDLPVPQRELLQHRQRFGARHGADDLELGAVLTPQIASDRLRDRRIVVDRQDRRLDYGVRPLLSTGIDEVRRLGRGRASCRADAFPACCDPLSR